MAADGEELSNTAAPDNTEWKVVNNGNQYIYEVAIDPNKAGYDFKASDGKLIGLSIHYNDCENGTREHQIGWIAGAAWGAANFGDLIFSGDTVAAVDASEEIAGKRLGEVCPAAASDAAGELVVQRHIDEACLQTHAQLAVVTTVSAIARLEEFCGCPAGSSRWIPLGAGLRARMTYGRLTIEPVPGRERGAAPVGPRAEPAPRSAVPLCVGGVTPLPRLGLRIESEWSAPPSAGPRCGRQEAVLDADALDGPLFVRTRRPGDRFQPLGAPGRCKLKDFLMARKVPADRRDRVPLLCDRKGIVWVVGHTIAERVKVTAHTRRVLRLEALPAGGTGP